MELDPELVGLVKLNDDIEAKHDQELFGDDSQEENNNKNDDKDDGDDDDSSNEQPTRTLKPFNVSFDDDDFVAKDKQTQDEDSKTIDIRTQIHLYLISPRFSTFLKKCGHDSKYEKRLEKMGFKELQRELKKIEFKIQTKNDPGIVENAAFVGISSVETIFAPRLNGLTVACRDESMLDNLEQIKIKNHQFQIENIYTRFLMNFGMKAFGVYQLNKINGFSRASRNPSEGRKHL